MDTLKDLSLALNEHLGTDYIHDSDSQHHDQYHGLFSILVTIIMSQPEESAQNFPWHSFPAENLNKLIENFLESMPLERKENQDIFNYKNLIKSYKNKFTSKLSVTIERYLGSFLEEARESNQSKNSIDDYDIQKYTIGLLHPWLTIISTNIQSLTPDALQENLLRHAALFDLAILEKHQKHWAEFSTEEQGDFTTEELISLYSLDEQGISPETRTQYPIQYEFAQYAKEDLQNPDIRRALKRLTHPFDDLYEMLDTLKFLLPAIIQQSAPETMAQNAKDVLVQATDNKAKSRAALQNIVGRQISHSS